MDLYGRIDVPVQKLNLLYENQNAINMYVPYRSNELHDRSSETRYTKLSMFSTGIESKKSHTRSGVDFHYSDVVDVSDHVVPQNPFRFLMMWTYRI